jgi:hypothetical protein
MALPFLLFRLGQGPLPASVVFRGPLPFANAGVGAEEEIEQPQPGGGRLVAYRRAEYVGQAYGVLPELTGRAYGIVGVVGDAAAILPAIRGSARGDVGEAGEAVAKFAINGRAGGDIGVNADGRAVVQIKAKASAARGVQGDANVQLSIKGCANGRNDADDMTAIVAILMAA